jgi:ubiquinone/menaquinone biosynthesis C-methylase UbiE
VQSSSNKPQARHKDLVREEFTRQASEYAQAAVIRDEAHIERLVRVVNPATDARVLEVATGPGYIAMAFARQTREAVGVDLTEAPLQIAEQKRLERGLDNVSFRVADAENLPFADGEFDVVVCRFAVHHFENPRCVLGEMARVCRTGGTVAVEDMIASEHRAHAEFHNRFERLRDTSHARAFPMSELLQMLADCGLEIERFESAGLKNPVERWLSASYTPPERADEVRAMIERDLIEDLSGTRPMRVDGELFFTHHAAIVVARKLKPRT